MKTCRQRRRQLQPRAVFQLARHAICICRLTTHPRAGGAAGLGHLLQAGQAAAVAAGQELRKALQQVERLHAHRALHLQQAPRVQGTGTRMRKGIPTWDRLRRVRELQGVRASHQVRVLDDALLQSPRVHDARTRSRELMLTWTLLTCVHGTQHSRGCTLHTATRLGSPMTRYVRVHVFKSPEKGSSVWGIINFAFNSHFTGENAVSR